MIVSLNEIGATAAKAVRGCGHPEGIAEEMGFAVQWLCQRQLPGLESVLSALDDGLARAKPVEPVVVQRSRRAWALRAAAGDSLTALRLAPSIVELAVVAPVPVDASTATCVVELDALTHPLLLVPFVARDFVFPLAVRWSTVDGPVAVEPSGSSVRIRTGSESALAAAVGRQVVVGSFEPDGSPPVLVTADDLDEASRRSLAGGCLVDDANWDRLCGLAARTYVPVSDESRFRGAGAGLTDND